MTYLYIKAFHLFFVVAWFAGLFYLPRIFVNLAMATEASELARLQLMANKLYRFMTPLAGIALAPIGKTVVDKELAAAVRGEDAQAELSRRRDA